MTAYNNDYYALMRASKEASNESIDGDCNYLPGWMIEQYIKFGDHQNQCVFYIRKSSSSYEANEPYMKVNRMMDPGKKIIGIRSMKF